MKTDKSIAQRIVKTKLFLFDLDGTLYIGDKLFDFTPRLLRAIRQSGRKYLFITNNSSKSVSAYVDKLRRLGIGACAEDFMTSSQATAYYLSENYRGKRLFVCGTESLKRELRYSGFEITDDIDKVECIVMGFDTELTFEKLEKVSKMLCTRSLPYIATNPDYVCPTEFGSVPDCGSICDMIYNATGKRPTVIGKPSPLMIELAMKKVGVLPSETAVIGDRVYTDVKSGKNAGVLGILVLSGETNPEMLKNLDESERPDIVLDSAGEMIRVIEKTI